MEPASQWSRGVWPPGPRQKGSPTESSGWLLQVPDIDSEMLGSYVFRLAWGDCPAGRGYSFRRETLAHASPDDPKGPRALRSCFSRVTLPGVARPMRVPVDEARSLSRARRSGSLVFLAACALSFGELCAWKLGGYSVDPGPVFVATAALAVLAATAAAVVAAIPRSTREIAVFVVFAPLTAWFVRHWLDAVVGASRNTVAWAAATAVAIPLALALARLARSRRTVAGIASIALILGLTGTLYRPNRGTAREHAPPGAPDLILLVLDTTRQDALSAFGNPRATTPYLDRFARRSLVYADAWSAAPWTPPSHASMFTGRLPAVHGVDGSARPEFPADILTLPETLRAAGYATAGFFANPVLDARGWSRGFDDYRPSWMRGRHSLPRFLIGHMRGLKRRWDDSAHATLGLGESWWRGHRDEPRFLFLNLIDPHDPYTPKRADLLHILPGAPEISAISQDVISYYTELPLTESDAYALRALYDAEVAGMDRELGRFFQRMALDRELDDAVVVITADHGERFGDCGVLGHSLTMDPYLLQVPLIVRSPDPSATGIVDRRVSTRYLPSYLSELAGLDAQPFGRPERLPDEDAPYAVAQLRESTWFIDQLLARDSTFDASPYRGNRCFVTDGEYAFRWIVGDDPSGTLIHLSTDPDWTQDLEEELPDVVERMEDVAGALPPFGDAVTEDVDPAARERLRALGYLD